MKFWIWSQEHGAWWPQNQNGYTKDLYSAGRFSVKETAEILERCNVLHRHAGKAPNEVAIHATIEFALIPEEMLEVESEWDEIV